MSPLSNSAQRDVETLLHPYTNLAAHRETGPMVLESGKGVMVRDDSGKAYIEGMSGLWCTSLGYGHQELVDAQEAVKDVYADDLIKEYIVSLCTATRDHPDVYLGVSPRGSLALYRTSQALAAVRHRDYIIPDDVKQLAEATLAHRLIISPAARIKNVDPREVILDILSSVPVPEARVARS